MKRIKEGSVAPVPDMPVMYVEDEESNWEVTRQQLSRKYKLLWAKTDKEACDLVRQHGGQFHAVLMDVQLKGSAVDGLKLAQLLRGKLPAAEVPPGAQGLPPVTCPIFFVTAYGNIYTPQQMEEAGGDAFVSKPVDFLKLTLLLASTNAKKAMASLAR